jgi:hypothetical protein
MLVRLDHITSVIVNANHIHRHRRRFSCPFDFCKQRCAQTVCSGACHFRAVHITLSLPCGEQKRQNAPRMKGRATAIAILPLVLAIFALAEDFKTVSGRVYKDATISSVEADGIVLRTNTGISKVYFTELPQDVQERFHWAKPDVPRKPFYGRWAAAAQEPAVLAKIIAVGTVIIAGVGLVIGYIRSRRQPIAPDRRSRRSRGKSLK